MNTQVAKPLFAFGACSMVYSFNDVEFLLNQLANVGKQRWERR